MGRHRKLDISNKDLIRSAYIQSHKNISLMARILKVDRKTLIKFLEKNPDVLLDFDLAEAAYIKQLENTIKQMALGVPELDSRGKFVRWIVKPNTDILIKEAEARMRYLGYGKQLDVNLDANVQGDSTIKAEISFVLSPMQLNNEEQS